MMVKCSQTKKGGAITLNRDTKVNGGKQEEGRHIVIQKKDDKRGGNMDSEWGKKKGRSVLKVGDSHLNCRAKGYRGGRSREKLNT